MARQQETDQAEKRGPIEKGAKGWPINPFGVVALLIFLFLFIFLIVRPLINQKTQVSQETTQNNPGGHIITPNSGDIISSGQMTIELSADEPQKVEKVQFWIKTYADGKWQMIGEVKNQPYRLDWQIPDSYKNKAVAITAHIFEKNQTEIKDPGGWKEGIIIIGQ